MSFTAEGWEVWKWNQRNPLCLVAKMSAIAIRIVQNRLYIYIDIDIDRYLYGCLYFMWLCIYIYIYIHDYICLSVCPSVSLSLSVSMICLKLYNNILCAMMYLWLPQYTVVAWGSFGTTSPGFSVVRASLVTTHGRLGSCLRQSSMGHGVTYDSGFHLTKREKCQQRLGNARHCLFLLPKHTKSFQTQSLCCLLKMVVQSTSLGMSLPATIGMPFAMRVRV